MVALVVTASVLVCGAVSSSQFVNASLEERDRVGVRFGLDVLWQADERGAAVDWIEHRLDSERQRLHELLRPDDAIPVARHRPEGVVDGDRWRVEVLDLLQHGIRNPALEGVAGEEQDRQAIGVRDSGRGDHVRRARPDRRGRDHDLAAAPSLRESDCRVSHSLLALAAVRRQDVSRFLERAAEACHVAVTKDREHAGEERDFLAVDDRALRDNEPDDRLSHRQLDGLHVLAPAALVIGQRGSVAWPVHESRIQP